MTSTLRLPPGPRGGGIRNLALMTRDPLGFITRTARTYGDVALVRVAQERLHLFSHPDHVHEVLVARHRAFRKSRILEEARRVLGDGLLTAEGEHHRRQRRMIQPAFHHARIAGYGAVMAQHANAQSDRWRDGQDVDIHDEMMRLTLGVAGRTLFGSEVAEHTATRVESALSDALSVYPWFMLPFSDTIEHMPLPGMRRFHRAIGELDSIVFGMIDERRAQNGSSPGGDDLLALLLAASDDEAESADRRMSDRQVRDEAMTIFLAGHETTANALSWAWYLLSSHPDTEERLAAEAFDVLEGRPAVAADLSRLPYARMVLAEAMRLYPPSWGMERRAIVDVEIGGWRVPAGSSVMVSQWIIHHDPRWFPDPFKFDPGRFTPEAVAARPRHAYFPFGAGPRMCIGEDFAAMEGTIVLATLAQRWRLRRAPGHTVGLEPRITLRPRGGIPMTVHRR
jgi:cytochrome P450